ncbi:MAG: polysialic acid transporter, partial [Sphaerotilus sp.]
TLEDGDVIRIPERSSLVLVSGEVLFPNAVVHDAKSRVIDYVQWVGGFNQGADQSRLLVVHQDGSVLAATESAAVQPGDEIMVLPKIDTKRIEITRGLTQIIYQIAVAAKVLLAL